MPDRRPPGNDRAASAACGSPCACLRYRPERRPTAAWRDERKRLPERSAIAFASTQQRATNRQRSTTARLCSDKGAAALLRASRQRVDRMRARANRRRMAMEALRVDVAKLATHEHGSVPVRFLGRGHRRCPLEPRATGRPTPVRDPYRRPRNVPRRWPMRRRGCDWKRAWGVHHEGRCTRREFWNA
jgi:hypothetical protein